ncbi:putative bifunctional diguanylate cyclase/phosphodiesterase [Agaribacterium sp. ZY112]|uniref:putative bifunctional diguanylate cyclase/phosphodiesterase n=1 Tax=Agaribacterium sp. ZY112 TaxID=3233574 RepID=UPI0035245527
MIISKVKHHWQAWGIVSCLALLLVLLALYAYQSAERSSEQILTFNESELPLFDEIQYLRTSLVSIESSVYEYYLTTDKAAFEERYSAHLRQFESSLTRLSDALGATSELSRLQQINTEMQSTTRVFIGVMSDKPIDWDASREVLSWFSPLTDRANEESAVLTQYIRQRVLDSSERYSADTRRTVSLVALLTLISILAGAWLARSNLRRLNALKEQQRLASFPSSNPHPVLSLSRDGRVMYANESAYIVALGADVDELLPSDLLDFLDEKEIYREWEYERNGRHLQISLGWLPQYNEYHAYLSDITARKKAEQDLEYLAYHDVTTGLIEREHFNAFVDQRLQLESQSVLVAILDLDLIDTVLEAAGVAISEQIARMAAERFKSTVFEEGLVDDSCLSYIGGGLFCFALPNNSDVAAHLFSRMQSSFEQSFDIEGYEFYLKLVIGVVTGEYLVGVNSEEALRLADGALNQAKQVTANNIVYYEAGIEQRQRFRMAVEAGLRHAITNDELLLYYQPKVSLIEGRIIGVEALVRWKTASGDWISPADFIPIAEDSGQIVDIGQWVLERACEDVSKWNQGRLDNVSVAVNVSAKQLLHSDLSHSVMSVLKRNKVPVDWIELEITETAALTDFEHALDKLHELRQHGIKISLDDFGTGYSSLSYLQRLPVQTLKIDQSFIRSLVPGSKDEALASTMVELAHQLEIAVVAEGVETEEQLQMLRNWGCEFVQGYLIAAPMPLEQFIAFKNEFNELPKAQNQC